MKKFREYLEMGRKIWRVPPDEEDYDRLEDNVKRYLEETWTKIADLALAYESLDIMGRGSFLQSPIEQLMYLGLLRVFYADFLVYPDDCVLLPDMTLKEVSKFLEGKKYDRLYFPKDVNYQLDVFLWLNKFSFGPPGERGKFAVSCIIECDGHDFHEKTKEQARKDRMKDRTLEERGLHVIRFTGSEITTDPEACALQVKSYVNSRMNDIRKIIKGNY